MNPSEMEKRVLSGKTVLVAQARIRRYVKHDRNYFEVDLGYFGGKRLRGTFALASKAMAFAHSRSAELRKHGFAATKLTTEQRIEAAACFDKLKPLGVRLPTAIDDYIRRHPLGGMGRTVEQVAEELIGKKEAGNHRANYVKNLAYRFDQFAEHFPNRPMTSISAEDLEKVLAKSPHWGPRTIKGVVSSWKVLFYYAMKRGYCTENPCLRLELPKNQDREPTILGIDAIRALFSSAKTESLDCTCFLALGLFTGIRPSEMAQLNWKQIDFVNKTVVVLSSAAKGRARRVVDMSDNLIAWLAPYKREAGPVLRAPTARYNRALSVVMKWDKWPQNVMRHCFASYHYGHHRNESLLMALMGHADDGRILHNHYRAVVQPLDAKAFWGLMPPNHFPE